MNRRVKLALGAALAAGALLLAALAWRGQGSLEPKRPAIGSAAPPEAAATSDRPPGALDAARPRTVLPKQGELATARRLSPTELRSGSDALELVRFGRDEVLKRRDGAFGFNSAAYGATLDRRSVRVATPYGIKGLGRPHLELRFEELRVGDLELAKGGVTEPRLDLESRAVTYARGSVEERYLLRPEGLEQIFVVSSLPERGAITLISRVSSNLQPPEAGRSGEKLAFTHRDAEVLSMSQAVAIDAEGKRERLALAYADGRVSMTIPAGWVAAATLPILIDPLIGGPVTIDAKLQAVVTSVQDRAVRTADVAYSAVRNEYLVVWAEPFGASAFNFDVLGQRVGPTGTLLGAALQIAASTQGDFEPTVCWASGADRYLVAWRQDPNDNSWDGDQRIAARVIDGAGAFVGAEFTAGDTAGQDFGPSAAFDGTRWYLCWTQTASAADLNARGVFVSTAGAPEAAADPDVDADYAAGPTAAFLGGTYVIAWEKQPAGGASGIVARTMNTTGAFTSAVVPVSQTTLPARNADLTAGAGTALVVWQEQEVDGSWDIRARIASPALVFSGSAFDIAARFSDQVTPRGAYSPASDAWYVGYTDPIRGRDDVFGNRVSSSGLVSPAERLTKDGPADLRPELAVNTTANEAFVVFLHRFGQQYRLKGRRVGLAADAPPTPGTPVAAPNPNNTGAHTVSWDPSTGTGLTYELERSADAGATFGLVATTSSASFLEPGIPEGSYIYRVRARSAEGVASAYSGSSPAVVVDQTPPPAPTALGQFKSDGVTAIPAGGTTLEGAVLVRATPTDTATRVRLEVEVKPAATPFDGGGLLLGAFAESGTIASVLASPLAEGPYHWRVRTADEAGNTGPFAVFGGNPDFIVGPSSPPAPPANLAATPGNAQVALTWDASAGADSYLVRRGTAPGGPYADVAPSFVTSYLDVSAANGSTYYYVVVALNAAGESGLSNEASASPQAPPAAPTNLVATPGNNQVDLTWTAPAGAASYAVRRSTSPSGPFEILAEGILETSYSDRTALNGTTYYYLVRAANVGGEGPDSAPASATPVAPPAAPTLSATPGDGQVTLNWTTPAGAASYSVYRSAAVGGPFERIASGIAGTSHIDTSLANGTEYFYAVTASNAGGESVFSNIESAVPAGAILAAPVITSASQTTNDATPTIEGTSVPSVTITVYFKQGGSTVETLTTTSSAGGAWSVTASPKPEGAYLVFARASSGASVSSDSNAITITVDETPPEVLLVTSSTPDGAYTTGDPIEITVSFSEPVMLEGGDLLVMLDAGAVVAIPAPLGPSTFVSGRYVVGEGQNSPDLNAISPLMLGPGASVRDAAGLDAFLMIPSGGQLGALKNIVIDTIPPAPPQGLSATPGNQQVTLSWTASPGAASYNLYRRLPAGSFGPSLASTPITSYVDSAVANGTEYVYVVRAVDVAGESGPSNEASATPQAPPAAPVITTPAKKTNDTSPLISGTAQAGSTVTVYFSGLAEPTTAQADPGGNWSLDPTTKADASYAVTATAANASGTSAPSAPVTIQVDTQVSAPLNVQIQPLVATIHLSWQAPADPDLIGYEVWRSTNGGTYSKIHSGVVVGTTFCDDAVSYPNQYCYQVRAVDNTLQEAP